MEVVENPGDQPPPESERRAGPRFDVDDDATLLILGDSRLLQGRVLDLSLHGCRMRTKERYGAGTDVRVEVSFRVNGIAFRLCGVAQWTNQWNVVGIEFVDVPQRRVRDLAEVVGEVEAEFAARNALQAQELLAAEALAESDTTIEQISDPASESEQAWIHAVVDEGHSVDPQSGVKPASLPLQKRTRERRAQVRHAVDTSAAICLIHSGSKLKGRVLDLSTEGCRIRTDDRFPVGIYTRIETEFHLEGAPFRLAGVIQVIHDRREVGIRFLDVSERKRGQLVRLIIEIEQMQEAAVKKEP
jgi:hypothetical protein